GLEQPAAIRRRVAPPVIVVAAEENLLPWPCVDPREIARHLRRLRRPRDVAGDDDRVLVRHRPVPRLGERGRVSSPPEAVHGLAARGRKVRVSDGEEAHGAGHTLGWEARQPKAPGRGSAQGIAPPTLRHKTYVARKVLWGSMSWLLARPTRNHGPTAKCSPMTTSTPMDARRYSHT